MRMRVQTLAAAAVVMLSIGALGTAPAAAQEPNPSEICDLFLEEGIEGFLGADISHGACVALVASGNPVPLFVSVCKSPEAIATVEAAFDVDVPDESVGKCLKFLKETFGDEF